MRRSAEQARPERKTLFAGDTDLPGIAVVTAPGREARATT